MTEPSIALLVCLALIVVLAILIYSSGRGQATALAGICDVRQNLSQTLTSTRNIELSMKKQRHVINDMHKRIYTVTKGVPKPTK
jgi:hypothetical protein